jgi:hypothetical protein
LALRLHPRTIYNMLKKEFGATTLDYSIVEQSVSWSRLCKAWSLYDEFREEPNNLSKLTKAYNELYKGVPDIYMLFATRLLLACKGCGKPLSKTIQGLCICVENVLHGKEKLSEVLSCLEEALIGKGYWLRDDPYYLYKECR